MRTARYGPEALVSLLRQRKIATMDDLKEALGTGADATVFRKLSELEYRTSYSHRGRYYTLDELARFDELGLWSFRAVWFSRFGTLVSTVEALVGSAEAGYDAAELEAVVNVEAKAALLKLVRAGRLAREQVAGRYVYLSPTPRRAGSPSARANERGEHEDDRCGKERYRDTELARDKASERATSGQRSLIGDEVHAEPTGADAYRGDPRDGDDQGRRHDQPSGPGHEEGRPDDPGAAAEAGDGQGGSEDEHP